MIEENRLAIFYLTNGQSFQVYHEKTPYISYVGEQYVSIVHEPHVTLYPFTSILQIELW